MTIARHGGIAWARLADVDPELWAAIRGETDRQRWKIELIASENYTFAGGDGGAGLGPHQQVRRRLPGKRYYGGCEFVDVAERLAQRARPAALRRRARQRPAPLRRPGQHGRLFRRPRARRHDPGHGPGPRRPPDPRLAGQLQRQVVRGPRLRRRPARPSRSTTTRWRSRRSRSGPS